MTIEIVQRPAFHVIGMSILTKPMSPDIPSLLVETAYISNPREEASLRSPKYQAALATALRQGIVDYFGGCGHRNAAVYVAGVDRES